MNLFTKQKHTHGRGKQIYGYQRAKQQRGIHYEFGINRYALLYIRLITRIYCAVQGTIWNILYKHMMEKDMKKTILCHSTL